MACLTDTVLAVLTDKPVDAVEIVRLVEAKLPGHSLFSMLNAIHVLVNVDAVERVPCEQGATGYRLPTVKAVA